MFRTLPGERLNGGEVLAASPFRFSAPSRCGVNRERARPHVEIRAAVEGENLVWERMVSRVSGSATTGRGRSPDHAAEATAASDLGSSGTNRPGPLVGSTKHASRYWLRSRPW